VRAGSLQMQYPLPARRKGVPPYSPNDVVDMATAAHRITLHRLGARILSWSVRTPEGDWAEIVSANALKLPSCDDYRSAVLFPWVNRLGGPWPAKPAGLGLGCVRSIGLFFKKKNTNFQLKKKKKKKKNTNFQI
jgi:hypothetical protein